MNKETLKNHLLFFLIYQKKVIRMLFTMFQICILKELELLKNYYKSLEYTWLCSLNGNKKCIKKLEKVKEKLAEEEVLEISKLIPTKLERIFK